MPVDAHQHFWNPARIPQPWMTAEHAAIAETFEPADLEPLLAESCISQTVLVQSAASDEDTDYLFEVADRVDWVGAIVAWCRLDDVAVLRARLGALRERPKLRGIRHLIHQEADPHWILRPEVAAGLAVLEEEQLVLELPVVYPNHLGDVPVLAHRYPGLPLVVDHLGKPPLGTSQMAHWEELLRGPQRPTCTQRSPASTRRPRSESGPRTTFSRPSTPRWTRSASTGSSAGATGRSLS
jgi:L-fuconolactonase